MNLLTKLSSLTTAFGIIKGLIGLVQPVQQLVETYETACATGEQKKAQVLAVVKLGIETADSVFSLNLPADTITGFVGKLIDIIVEFKNLVGEFKHSGKTTQAA
jgi:hypothetical protein